MNRILFPLDADGRWRLAHDAQQWIIQRKTQAARPGDSHGIRDSGWRGVSFVGSEKRVLHRCIREHGVALTPEARARLDSLPDRFVDVPVDRAAMKPPASRRAA